MAANVQLAPPMQPVKMEKYLSVTKTLLNLVQNASKQIVEKGYG